MSIEMKLLFMLVNLLLEYIFNIDEANLELYETWRETDSLRMVMV